MADEVKKANWFNPSLNWRERGLPKPGRKADYARLVIKNRFGLTERQGVLSAHACATRSCSAKTTALSG